MKKKRRLLTKNEMMLKAVAFFLTGILFWGCGDRKIEISNQNTDKLYYSCEVNSGDILIFEWEHSFEHILWKEYYKITKENEFKLFSIATEGFGAGIPAEMDCEYRYENGLIYMENIQGSYFLEFNWIHSQKQLKRILLNEKEIISGRDLPEHEKINLSIKNKK